MLAFLKKLIFAFLLCVVALFLYQNATSLSQTTQFSFDLYTEGWQYTTPFFPVVFLFGVFFLVGLLAAGTHSFIERFSHKSELRSRDKQIKKMQAELSEFHAQEAKLEAPKPAMPPVVTTNLAVSEPERSSAPLEDEPTL